MKYKRSWIILAGLVLLIVAAATGIMLSSLPKHDPQITALIPQPEEWVDYGTILTAGEEGEWNYYLFGAFAATAVKVDGTTYLYYQGASGYRTVDETVTGRAIGVATSPDGINFTPHPDNPILTWSPWGNGEEGAVSSGAAVSEDQVVMIYGANTEETATKINADARLAVSTDGINFTDQGIVLDHRDRAVWGAGDELFPIIAFTEAGRWFVYYLPNGVPQRHQLGVAWGDGPQQLTNSTRARIGPIPVGAWGTGGYARLAPGIYAIFLNNVEESRTTVHTISTDAPNLLSLPVVSYQFDDYRQATVLLDVETRTWFMYYRNSDQTRYGVKLAPAGPIDDTPPTAPPAVAAACSHNQILLTWEPAVDADTGIAQYRLYQNGGMQTAVKGWSYQVDMTVEETVEYLVTAVNYHGIEGPRSEPVLVTPADCQ